jgi:Contractile injection system tube protein
MPRNLEPTQIALDAELARGALIALPDPRAKNTTQHEILRFQYNPDTVTRSRTGQFERKLDKKASNPAQVKAEMDAARGGALKSKSEIISFKLVFDAAELIMRGGDPLTASGVLPTARGVLPELALLERFALGPDQIPDPPKKDNEFELVTLAPTEALLLLGPRKFPGVITQLNIVEQRFNTQLVPVRAEVDLRFRVLETTSVAVSKDTQKAFQELLEQRRKLVEEDGNQFTSNDLNSAIDLAVKPRSAPPKRP